MIFQFIRRHLTGTINWEGGKGGQINGENSASTIIANTKLLTKNVTEFWVVSDYIFYYFYIIQLFDINNYLHFCTKINKLINLLITRWKKNYVNKSYSPSYNLTPAISWVLTGRHWFFAHPLDERAVTHLKNVRQLKI